MAHINVPHTIQRDGYYYLNIRIKTSIFRYSLKTKDPQVACSIILRIIEFIKTNVGSSNMEKSLIQRAVSIIQEDILKKLRAVIELIIIKKLDTTLP